MEVQNFQTALKTYMSGKGKKLSRLIEYAEKLGKRDEVMNYQKVLQEMKIFGKQADELYSNKNHYVLPHSSTN